MAFLPSPSRMARVHGPDVVDAMPLDAVARGAHQRDVRPRALPWRRAVLISRRARSSRPTRAAATRQPCRLRRSARSRRRRYDNRQLHHLHPDPHPVSGTLSRPGPQPRTGPRPARVSDEAAVCSGRCGSSAGRRLTRPRRERPPANGRASRGQNALARSLSRPRDAGANSLIRLSFWPDPPATATVMRFDLPTVFSAVPARRASRSRRANGPWEEKGEGRQ